jgi:hypothetical protein
MQDFAGVCYFACFSCGDTNRNRAAQSSQTSGVGDSGGGGGAGLGLGLGVGAEREYPLETQSHRESGVEWGAAGSVSDDRLGGFLLPSGYEMSLMLRYRLGMGAGARHGQVSGEP